jgi:hypothetical protein
MRLAPADLPLISISWMLSGIERRARRRRLGRVSESWRQFLADEGRQCDPRPAVVVALSSLLAFCSRGGQPRPQRSAPSRPSVTP